MAKLTPTTLDEIRQLLDQHGWTPNATESAAYGVLSWASPHNDTDHPTPPPLDQPGNRTWGQPTYRRMFFAEVQVLGERIVFVTRTAAAPWVGVDRGEVTRPKWVAYVEQNGSADRESS